MTTRELLKKLQEIPEEYLDKEVVYDDGYDYPVDLYGVYVVEENEYLSDYIILSQEEVDILKNLKENLDNYPKDAKLDSLRNINLPCCEKDTVTEINDYITWIVNDLTLDRAKGTLILT